MKLPWELIPFENNFLIPPRNGINRPSAVRGKGYKMINMGEIFAYDRLDDIDMELVLLNDKEKETYQVNVGDLIFARQSIVAEGAGKCSIIISVSKMTCFESHIIRIRLNKSKASSLFYYYLFQSNLGKAILSSIRQQGVQAGIRGSDLANVKVPAPPLQTQKQIAEILSAYDDLIETNSQRIATLEQLAQQIYKEWFVRMRFPGWEQTHFHQGVPGGWEVKKIGDLCSKITDGSHFSPSFVLEGKPMASVKDMDSFGFSLEGIKTISEQDFEKLKNSDCMPQKDDILIAKDGSYLKHVFVWNGDYEIVILSSIAILRPHATVSPYYLSLTLKQDSTKSMMSCYVSGAALPRIILDDFKKMKILVPDSALQLQFDEVIKPMFQQIKILIEQNQNLEKTRNLLLPRLISGKLSIKQAESQTPNPLNHYTDSNHGQFHFRGRY